MFSLVVSKALGRSLQGKSLPSAARGELLSESLLYGTGLLIIMWALAMDAPRTAAMIDLVNIMMNIQTTFFIGSTEVFLKK